MNLKIFVIGACSFPTVKYVRNGTKAIAMQIIEDTAECLHFDEINNAKTQYPIQPKRETANMTITYCKTVYSKGDVI